MADQQRTAAALVAEPATAAPSPEAAELLRALAERAYGFDFYQALRRIECAYRDRPRWGMAQFPGEEPLRLGQEVSLAAAPATLSRLAPASDTRPARLHGYFLGMLGPNGPLPLHLTDYARQRAYLSGDASLVSFLDMFHHRLLALFYRAHAASEPAYQRDRPEADRFASYVAALIGLGMPGLRDRDEIPDDAKLYYAGLLAPHTRNASGLRALIEDFFRLPARIEELIGEWVTLPRSQGWQLGLRGRRDGAELGKLGKTALVGTRVWLRQHRFRVVLGPLRREQFRAFLPGSQGLRRLTALVRTYVGDELKWDVRLTLLREAVKPLQLGAKGQLGRTSWLVARAHAERWEDLIVDPFRSPAAAGGPI